jgi:hypothetical protein
MGLETAGGEPAGGPPTVSGRGHLFYRNDAGSLGARVSVSDLPSDRLWSALLQGRHGPWFASWKAGALDRVGQATLGWSQGRWDLGATWGPSGGTTLDLGFSSQVLKVDLNTEAEVAVGPEGATGRVSLGASGGLDRGRWSGKWSVGPGDSDPVQTVVAGWREPSFEAEARWKVEGLRLGWFGPGTTLTTTVRVLF